MSRLHLSAPLPFVGQKRNFAKPFIDVIRRYPEGTTFVDLFGGSGLLSHIARHVHPGSRVIYNDYDNYRRRIDAIPRTNAVLSSIRPIANRHPRHKPISGPDRELIFSILEEEERETGFLDLITLSSSLLFSMKYRLTIADLRRETLYNNVRKSDYRSADGYLDGLEIVSLDYRTLFDRFRDAPGTVFIIDPPYLSTEVGTYRIAWRLADYLDVLSILPGHDFIYFTSDKSAITDLCQWMGRNPGLGDPFAHCSRRDFKATLNHAAGYTDIMLFTPPSITRTSSNSTLSK